MTADSPRFLLLEILDVLDELHAQLVSLTMTDTGFVDRSLGDAGDKLKVLRLKISGRTK